MERNQKERWLKDGYPVSQSIIFSPIPLVCMFVVRYNGVHSRLAGIWKDDRWPRSRQSKKTIRRWLTWGQLTRDQQTCFRSQPWSSSRLPFQWNCLRPGVSRVPLHPSMVHTQRWDLTLWGDSWRGGGTMSECLSYKQTHKQDANLIPRYTKKLFMSVEEWSMHWLSKILLVGRRLQTVDCQRFYRVLVEGGLWAGSSKVLFLFLEPHASIQ